MRECSVVVMRQPDGSIERIARVNATEGWQRLVRRACYGPARCRGLVALQQANHKADTM